MPGFPDQLLVRSAASSPSYGSVLENKPKTDDAIFPRPMGPVNVLFHTLGLICGVDYRQHLSISHL